MLNPGLSVPEAVAALIQRSLPSLDHVEILLALRDAGGAMEASAIARDNRFAADRTAEVLGDLVRTGAVLRRSGGFVIEPALSTSSTVEELSYLFHTRPVALVRAIYSRL